MIVIAILLLISGALRLGIGELVEKFEWLEPIEPWITVAVVVFAVVLVILILKKIFKN